MNNMGCREAGMLRSRGGWEECQQERVDGKYGSSEAEAADRSFMTTTIPPIAMMTVIMMMVEILYA